MGDVELTGEQVQRIASRLTRPQRSTIINLDDAEYDLLTCAEATALRLTKGGPRRPPLVEVRAYSNAEWPNFDKEFRLNPLGARVKAALAQAT